MRCCSRLPGRAGAGHLPGSAAGAAGDLAHLDAQPGIVGVALAHAGIDHAGVVG